MLSSQRLDKALGILLFLLVFIFSCSKKNNSVLELNIVPDFDSLGKSLRMNITIKSKAKDTIIFDKDVYSVFNPRFESSDFLAEISKGKNVFDEIKHSQLIVENNKHVKRVFSDIRLFEGEVIPGKSIFMLEPDYDTIYLDPKIDGIIHTDYININRLKNDVNDSLIRVTYVFKPTEEQMQLGFRSRILTSNWFSIDPNQVCEKEYFLFGKVPFTSLARTEILLVSSGRHQ